MNILFRPESDSYIQAAEEYISIWNNEKNNILAVIKKISKLDSTEHEIIAIVYEGISFSGKDTLSPMKLRASYPIEIKKATLIHELLHRFLFQLKERLGYDEHEILFLILYDIWEDLYGKEFAERQVAVESNRKGHLDYATLWKNTLNQNRDERQIKWRDLLRVNNLL